MHIQLRLDFLDNFFFGFIRCSFEQYSLSSISLTDNSVRNFWEEKGYHLLPENEYVQEALGQGEDLNPSILMLNSVPFLLSHVYL